MSEEQWTMDDVKRWLETEKIASEVQARVMQRLDRMFLEIKVMAQLSEREACAKIADIASGGVNGMILVNPGGIPHNLGTADGCAAAIAAAIRARGKTE